MYDLTQIYNKTEMPGKLVCKPNVAQNFYFPFPFEFGLQERFMSLDIPIVHVYANKTLS